MLCDVGAILLYYVGDAAIETREDEIAESRRRAFGRVALTVPVLGRVAITSCVTVTELVETRVQSVSTTSSSSPIQPYANYTYTLLG